MALGDRICTLTIEIVEGAQGFHQVEVIELAQAAQPSGGRVISSQLLDPARGASPEAKYDSAIGFEVGKVVRRP